MSGPVGPVLRAADTARKAVASLQLLVERLDRLAARTPGLRVGHKLGRDRLFRTAGLAFWLGVLLMEPLVWRPDLLHPTDIGSDASNYAAATERLVDGHDLYALVPGDRPTPADNPPEWSVPILSPPPIVTVNLWQVLLPDTVRIYLSWVVGLGAMAAFGLILITTAPPVFVLLLLYLSPGLATTAWSGNVNALIAPAVALVWWTSQKRELRWQALAGLVVATVAAAKIGPLFVGIWLISQQRWTAVKVSLAAGLVIGVATIVMAGPNVIGDYLAVARFSVASPTHLSIPGILRDLGASVMIQTVALPVAVALAVAGMFYWRRWPFSFLIAVFAMIFSTPVVRAETAAISIAAAVAWIPGSARYGGGMGLPPRSTVLWAAVPVTALAAIVVAVSLATGGGDRSTIAIANHLSQPVVVRFSLYGQAASFGFSGPVDEPVYAWLDRAGASPPIATVWSPDCTLIELIVVPRTGAVVAVDASGVHLATVRPPTSTFAEYDPSCAAELTAYFNPP